MSSLLLPVGLQLAALLVRVASAAADPSLGTAAAVLGDSGGVLDRLRQMRSGDDPQRLGKRLAEELERRLEQETTAENRRELRGAATEVEALLAEIRQDDDAVLAAVRNPETFPEYLRKRATGRRRNVAQAAEPVFDALVQVVAEEFMLIAPNSPAFDTAHARYVMDTLDDLTATADRTEAKTDAVLAGQAGIAEDVREIKTIVSSGAAQTPMLDADHPLRFGSIPKAAPGFEERPEYDRLREALSGGGSATISALQGMKGVGKSQIAAKYARECWDAGWPLVAWINASPAGDPDKGVISGVDMGLARLATRLKIVEDSDSVPARAEALVDWLNSGPGADCLIVFDNLERADDLRDRVPEAPGVRVIVTTNLQGRELGETIPVGVFSEDQSRDFLHHRLPGITDPEADQLAQTLGHLPLALAQAAGTILGDRCGVATYMEFLADVPLEEAVDRSDGDQYPDAVWQALRLAYTSALKAASRKNTEQGHLARLQLGALALMSENGVADSWLHRVDGKESYAAIKALRALRERSVVAVADDDHMVSLHRLQSRVIREDMIEPELTDAAAVVVSLLDSALPNSSQDDQDGSKRQTISTVIEHLAALGTSDHSAVANQPDAFADVLCRTQVLANHAGVSSSVIALDRIVNAIGVLLGPTHQNTLASHHNLAGAYQNAGYLEKATTMYEQVLADCERILGPNHPGTLTSRNNLASAYQEAGHLGKATMLHQQILTDREKVLGPDHADTLTSRNNLASTYLAAGRVDEAIGLFKQVWTDHERILGPDHPGTLTSRNNLAGAYQEAGHIQEAIDLHEQVLTDHERILGLDHPGTLNSRNNLASAYQAAGRIAEAITLHEQVLADSEQVLGPDHPGTLTFRNNLASTYQKAERLGKAIGLFKQVLADRLRAMGPDHPGTLTSRNNLAGAYQEAGHLDEAITLFEETLTDRERVLGLDHPHSLGSRHNLAGAYQEAGRLEEAIDLFVQVLADCERVLGTDHSDTLTSRHNLASAYWESGDQDKAIALLDQVLADHERVLGPDHPSTTAVRENLEAARRALEEQDPKSGPSS